MLLRQRVLWTLTVMVLVTASPVAGQSDNARLLADAEKLLNTAAPAGARPLLERVLEAARLTATEADIARAQLGLGEIARSEGRVADARPRAVEALAISERLGDRLGIADATYLLARLEYADGRQAAAVEQGTRALAMYEALGHHRGIAGVSRMLVRVQDFDIDLADRLLERSAAAARAAGDHVLEGEALHDYGDTLFNAGRYEQSLQLLVRAAAAFEAGNAPDDVGTVYNSIGRVYRAHGRLDEALRYQKAALELHRKSTDKFMLVQSLNAVASVYQRQNEFAAARPYLEEALQVAALLPASAASARALDFLRANMASLLREVGQLEAAAAALEQVIASGRDGFPSVRYAQLSRAYRDMGRGAQASAAAERAVALCGSSKTACIDAYITRSEARALLGDRDGALSDLSIALERIEDQRAHLLPSDFAKQGFTAYYEQAYGSAVARQLDAGHVREALETAELARSRAFLDLLASRSVMPSVPAPGPALPLTLRGGASTEVASPVTAASADAASLIRTAARLRSSLLLYWVSDSETVIWVVRADGRVHARRVKVTRAKLAALVRGTAPFASATAAGGGSPVLRQSAAAWRELYTLLIAPVKTLLPAARGALLTIVPNDTLSNLSFAALQDGTGRYLLEDYTLHYAPAGALFEFTQARRQPQPRASPVLMVSDPDPVRRSTLDSPLPRLPGARQEAAAIARQLQAGQVLSLSGAAATESSVRALAPTRGILHFAAHTVMRDNDPFSSYLALGGSGTGDADGVLTAQDVYGLHLTADLVVLSACRSASGTIAGDGVATFARAFVYAGAASLIASVWDVADEPSNRLMPDFYRAWLGGATKAAALRQAQLRLLADLRRGRVHVTTPIGPVAVPEHPVFWAGFALFGEPD